MPSHVVNTIADKVVTLLSGNTDAGTEVARDRAVPRDRAQLPAIDVGIGAEEIQQRFVNKRRAELTIIVRLIAFAGTDSQVSTDLVTLRGQVYKQLITAGHDLGLADVIDVEETDVSEVVIEAEPSVPYGALRVDYTVTYQHDILDPEV